MAQTATVTLLFCDLVGSTAWQSALGDDAADEVRPALFTALRSAVEDHGGRDVKNLGDGLIAVFATSGAAALDAAAAMQRRFADEPEWPPLRVGVATGEATSEEDDWFGTPVATWVGHSSATSLPQVCHTGPSAWRW